MKKGMIVAIVAFGMRATGYAAVAAVCLIFAAPGAQAKRQTPDVTEAAPQSTAGALSALDNAKTMKEWNAAARDLRKAGRIASPELRRYYKDHTKDGRKRFLALWAMLGNEPDGDAVGELVGEFKDDPDAYFRVSCALWLGALKNENGRKVLRQVVGDEDEPGLVRTAAAAALADMRDDAGKEVALDAVLHARPWNDVGMLALERLKANGVLPILRARIESSTEYYVRNACRLAILRIGLSGESKGYQVELLQEALMEGGFFQVSQWAALRLGDLGGDAARRFLARLCRDPRAPVRLAAQRGFMRGAERGHWTLEEAKPR